MKSLEEIEKELTQKGIEFWYENDNQTLVIQSCQLGNNFYDYEEEPPEKLDFSLHPELKELEDDPRIYILWCSACCGCAGW